MEGFVFTEHGWVQSYGSRYVRPPIIHGDVTRPHAMTTKEFQYAQSLTQKPVKGMLTGETQGFAALSLNTNCWGCCVHVVACCLLSGQPSMPVLLTPL